MTTKNRIVRIIHAQRARKLRRRGELVEFYYLNKNGRAVYKWYPHISWPDKRIIQ